VDLVHPLSAVSAAMSPRSARGSWSDERGIRQLICTPVCRSRVRGIGTVG
jgi:hypothetical protein